MALAAIVSNTKVLYSNWFKRISGDTHKVRQNRPAWWPPHVLA